MEVVTDAQHGGGAESSEGGGTGEREFCLADPNQRPKDRADGGEGLRDHRRQGSRRRRQRAGRLANMERPWGDVELSTQGSPPPGLLEPTGWP